jgi:hypothetical protein
MSLAGVDFTKPFTFADPKSAKRHSSHQCLFVLLGPAYVKAVHKHFGEIDPRCEQILIMCISKSQPFKNVPFENFVDIKIK